jgi:murein DD-endopeptidase MepM/ murein hydrolase activator NlpD
MRLLALLFGLLLALPAAAAPPDGGFCGRMLMPAVQLRELSRGFSAHHSGVDLMAPYGSPIRAAAGGTVVYAGWYYAYGKIVDIQHADGVITRYAHMSAFAPGIAHGTPVAAGEVIGQIGTSGNAHGAHVHFEVRIDGHPVDPKPYLSLAACPITPPLAPLEEARTPSSPAARADLASPGLASAKLANGVPASPAEVRQDR